MIDPAPVIHDQNTITLVSRTENAPHPPFEIHVSTLISGRTFMELDDDETLRGQLWRLLQRQRAEALAAHGVDAAAIVWTEELWIHDLHSMVAALANCRPCRLPWDRANITSPIE